MKRVLSIVTICLCWSTLIPAQYQHFHIPDAQSLRGIASLSETECWVSGAIGKVFKTTDAGMNWLDISPKGYDSLDFRDIQVFDAQTALIMSSGYPTRILKTSNGGSSWKLTYQSDDERVFLDAMGFWDDNEGIVFGDAIGTDLIVIRTHDQGDTWVSIDTAVLPNVSEGQGGFAASGTCLITFGKDQVLIGLGGQSADVVSSQDRGKSWSKSRSPLSAGVASAGIFSFSFLNSQIGLCAGGDYTGDSVSQRSLAITFDGGKNWLLIRDPAVDGYYHSSCLIIDEQTMLTISRYGSSWSYDGGKTWQRTEEAYFSLSGFDGGFWASGPEGKVGRWKSKP